MKNPVGRLKTAWYDKMNGSLTYNSVSVPVYREDANQIPSSHYVLIRAGGSQNQRTSDSFMRRVSIFIQIVTKFSGAEGINDSIVEDIDEQISEIINPTTSDDALVDGVYFQVNDVNSESDTYETFIDTDQSIKYHIKTTTWTALVIQKN